jgi:nucleoside-diphosphate-sugar epimerase
MSRGPVCVSGVTGCIAARLVKDLLSRGYIVHGTARGLSDPGRVAHVTGLAQNLRLFEAELPTPGALKRLSPAASLLSTAKARSR